MYYKVKKSDTLKKIASKHNVPVELLMAFNPSESDNEYSFSTEELIYIPNTLENPEQEYDISRSTTDEVIEKAKSAFGKGVKYKLGGGGMAKDLNHHLPSHSDNCDCSGFVCWVFGISRQSDIPFYKTLGGWINTDTMVLDIKSHAGVFVKLDIPEKGCIAVYARRKKDSYGHVGIVSEVENGIMKKVIHCSKGNDKPQGNSIQETSAKVFDASDVFFGRFVG